MTKINVFKDQSTPELSALLQDKRKELFELKNKRNKEKKLDEGYLLTDLKKDIARILTLLRARELAS